MSLDTWMKSVRWFAVDGRSKAVSRRRRDQWKKGLAEPAESLEPRVLLTIDVDQPFAAPTGPIAQMAERFDANGSVDLVTLSADGRTLDCCTE